ncbi:MAG TPA: tripartite tricarboxylate transporter substrate-binding protein [Burkholderiaceae bacterium]|nr:tripartite tricarboxylate transporter substrate-binding protein [Burkholderiaceae bacterium]
MARLLGDALAVVLRQPVVVEPRPGGSGVLAVNELKLAPPDGHTLLVAVNSLASEVPHMLRLRLDMARELRPLAELATHVGYKGSTPALADLMGSHVPLLFDGLPSALPLLAAGRIKAYAFSSPRRSPLLPALREQFRRLGFEPGSGRTPQALQQSVETGSRRVGALLREIGFVPE